MTFSDVIAEIRAFDEQARRDGSVAWYRGHRSSRWELQPTLHRLVERFTSRFTAPAGAEQRREILRAEYKRIYRRFKADAWPLLDARERSDWGIVFAMQHYGQPTRLLDWTESFACALFFAQLRRDRNEEAAIWALDPQALNKVTASADALIAVDEDMSEANVDGREWHPKWVAPDRDLPTIAVAPVFTNPRMTAQRAAFTMAGDVFEPLDREIPSLVDDGYLHKFVLPPDTFDAAAAFLKTAGLDPYSFFPDLQGLALRHEADTEQRILDASRWYPHVFKS
jgi:hypothetical protein